MSDPQARRRRQPSPQRSSAGGTGGGGPLPMAALIIGVIVAGLGIGALISAFQNRTSLPELGATSVPAVTPVPQATAAPPLAALPATPVPLPSPSVTESPSPVPTPATSPSPPPTGQPTLAPSAALTPPPAAATPTPVPVVTPPPATPAPPPAVKPTAAPAVRPPAAAANPGDAAVGVVRRYIDDLIAGDEAGAYAALSDRSLTIKEEAFLDKDARITSLHVTGTDPTGTMVSAEIKSSHGSYVATFHVAAGPNGGTINQHDYVQNF